MITELERPTQASRMRDRDVRMAVLRKVLREHVSDASTRVIEELGVDHGNFRIDIAVVNGFLHGFELKSESDTLQRLPAQAEAFSRTFDRVTLVVDALHHRDAIAMVPAWWGIKVARLGPRGAVHIETLRPVVNNPDVCLLSMAHLLWRNEAVDLLERIGAEKKALRNNRASLCQLLVDSMEPRQLRHVIRERLRHRGNWRDRASPS